MASSSKIRCLMNPDEVESFILREKDKRKVARLLQVRCQSKEAAARIRQSVQKEKEKQIKMAGSKAKAKKLKAIDAKLDEWSEQYSKCLGNVAESHGNAKLQNQLLKAQRQRTAYGQDIAVIRGKEAAIKMKITKNQQKMCESDEIKKRQDAVKRENTRAANIRNQLKLRKNPVDDLDLRKACVKNRPNVGKLQKIPVKKITHTKSTQKNLQAVFPENKENADSSTQTISSETELSSKRSTSRKKLRVSVGYKSQKSKTMMSGNRGGRKRKNRTSSKSSSVSSLADDSINAGQLALELNAKTIKRMEEEKAKEISSDSKCKERFKSAMDKVKMEKNRNEVLQTLDKWDKAEQMKKHKENNDEELSPQKARQELQLHLEKLVEDMMHKRLEVSSSQEDADETDVALSHRVAKSPEMIKINSPSVMDSSVSSVSSPEDFIRRSSPDMKPAYMSRLPTLKPSSFKNYRLSTLPSAQMRWVDESMSQNDNAKTATSKPIRRKSVHNDVVRRQLIRNFLENHGIQTPTPKKKAFTKTYLDAGKNSLFPDLSKESPVDFAVERIHRSPEPSKWADVLDSRTKLESPAITRIHKQPEVTKVDDDNQSDFSFICEPQPQTDWSLSTMTPSDSSFKNISPSPTESSEASDSQSENSVIRDERKFVENEIKISECSKEMARIDDEQRQLQQELEEVRKRKRELGLPPIDESKQSPDPWDENAAVNVTVRRRCPPTYNRAMDRTPHELSTVVEVDTPRSSYASVRGSNEATEKLRGMSPDRKITSTPNKFFKSPKLNTPDGPGIMEEPEITLVDYDLVSSSTGSQSAINSPNLMKRSHLSQTSKSASSKTHSPHQISPMTAMLYKLRDKLMPFKAAAREHVCSPPPPPRLSPESLTDSLMSFQRHELSAYSDLSQSTPEKQNSPPPMSPEVNELLEKWKEKYKSRK